MLKGVHGETTHRNTLARVRRIAVANRRHSTEKIARQCKSDHLPPPVGQQLVQTRNTRRQIVDGSRDLAGRKERLIRIQLDLAADPLELDNIRLVERTADAERPDGAGRTAADTGAQ